MRRAIFFALLAWLPIVVWAGYTGRALSGVADEPLLQHFGIHVRFLIAVPLFILGEEVLHGLTAKLIPYFLTSGLVREEQREALREVVQGIVRLRNSTLPWLFIAVIILAWLMFEPPHSGEHELVWAKLDRRRRSIQLRRLVADLRGSSDLHRPTGGVAVALQRYPEFLNVFGWGHSA